MKTVNLSESASILLCKRNPKRWLPRQQGAPEYAKQRQTGTVYGHTAEEYRRQKFNKKATYKNTDFFFIKPRKSHRFPKTNGEFQAVRLISLACSICLIVTAQIASNFLPSTVLHYSPFP